jgi:high-affinity nickel-transport protein
VWDGVGALNNNFNELGFIIIVIFIVAWIGSIVIYRYKGLDGIEVTGPSSGAD